MTHIICRASSCLFWEQGVCGTEEIEYEPDTGCLTFQEMGDLELEAEEGDDFEWEDDGDLFQEDKWDGEDDSDWDDDEI